MMTLRQWHRILAEGHLPNTLEMPDFYNQAFLRAFADYCAGQLLTNGLQPSANAVE